MEVSLAEREMGRCHRYQKVKLLGGGKVTLADTLQAYPGFMVPQRSQLSPFYW